MPEPEKVLIIQEDQYSKNNETIERKWWKMFKTVSLSEISMFGTGCTLHDDFNLDDVSNFSKFVHVKHLSRYEKLFDQCLSWNCQ
jgi:hypothetical protein